MTKRELAEMLLTRVPKDELDDVMQLLVYRQRKPANLRPSVVLDPQQHSSVSKEKWQKL
jgi:hypothetical protein